MTHESDLSDAEGGAYIGYQELPLDTLPSSVAKPYVTSLLRRSLQESLVTNGVQGWQIRVFTTCPRPVP